MPKIADHVILISLDAVSKEDFEALSSCPNFKGLLEQGCFCTNVETVTPAQTYTIHASIVTGVHPKKHKIYNNVLWEPGIYDNCSLDANLQTWHSCRSDIKSQVIYEAAQKKGLTTASLLWPITEKSSIDFNVPEIAAMPGQSQILRTLLGGSIFFTLGIVLRFYKDIHTSQPGLDRLCTLCSCDCITRKKPHLALIHLTGADYAKHEFGTRDRKKIEVALQELDRNLGKIVASVKQAGIYERTTFLIISDHGQIQIDRSVHLNNVFKRHGFIQTDTDNKLIDYDAYAQSAGNTALIGLKNPTPDNLLIISQLLQEYKQKSEYGIKDIIEQEQIAELGSGFYQFIIQGEANVRFSDHITNDEDFVLETKPQATHGYTQLLNLGSLNCIFVASGCGIKRGVELKRASILDYAPTIARILDLENVFNVEECDGTILNQIFQE